MLDNIKIDLKENIMVKIQHKGTNPEKIDSILETAQNRFAMYGFEKVTMKEIATDMNMTKGSLYYYFPDKEHLYKAVIQKEFDEFLDTISEKIGKMSDPAEMLWEFVTIRLFYFRQFMNLSRFKLEELPAFKSLMGDFWIKTANDEAEIVKDILATGESNGQFHFDDLNKTALLFLDVLKGLRTQLIRTKSYFYLDEEEYKTLTDKTMRFAGIFIKGISR